MKKRILISVASVLLIALILTLCSFLVVPKYTDPKLYDNRLMGEYYAEAGGHDVIFIGDCEVYESFIPAVMWEKYGISSYVRGTPQQLAWHSYYILEETFKYETPKAVVFNVLALKYGEPQSEIYNRSVFDGMKWSDSKVKGIIASMTEEESFLDYVFPLLRFHSRVTELTGDDFKYAFTAPEKVSNSGYLMQTGIDPIVEGTKHFSNNDPLPDSAMEYLEKMRLLCEEKGSELILVKAPTDHWEYHWYSQWETQISEYAAAHGLSYYNLIEKCTEIGIDWSVDTYDKGAHLNVYGAEKTSVYFGEILAGKHGIADKREDPEQSIRWQGLTEKYHENKKAKENDQ